MEIKTGRNLTCLRIEPDDNSLQIEFDPQGYNASNASGEGEYVQVLITPVRLPSIRMALRLSFPPDAMYGWDEIRIDDEIKWLGVYVLDDPNHPTEIVIPGIGRLSKIGAWVRESETETGNDSQAEVEKSHE